MKLHLWTVAIGLSGLCLSASGITLNQVDDFEDNSTMSWFGGANPSNISTGGPAGAGDSFLQISRTDFPGNLGTTNADQWTGDYLSAGVTAIQFDLNHLAGSTPVNVRLMIFGPGGAWASANTTLVTSGWNTYTFNLNTTDMVSVDAFGTLADTLSNVGNLLFRHDSSAPTPPGFGPPPIIATLGIDNVRAIPEPACAILLSLAALVLLRQRGMKYAHI